MATNTHSMPRSHRATNLFSSALALNDACGLDYSGVLFRRFVNSFSFKLRYLNDYLCKEMFPLFTLFGYKLFVAA